MVFKNKASAHDFRLRSAIVLVILLVIAAGSAIGLYTSQQRGRHFIERNFAARGALTADFTTAFVNDAAGRQQLLAIHELSGLKVTRSAFERAATALGASAALAVDSEGRVIQVLPSRPSFIGTKVNRIYPEVQQAENGLTGVSNVIQAGTNGRAIAGFTVPFDATNGDHRVFSAAFAISSTPLAPYLKSFAVHKETHYYLVDAKGAIVASNRNRTFRTLKEAEPKTAKYSQYRSAATGVSGAGNRTVSMPVAQTPWRVVITTPNSLLFQTVSGPRQTLPWVAWLIAVMFALACWVMAFRLMRGRRELAVMNTKLNWLSHSDPLTELLNRRGFLAASAPLVAVAERENTQLGVLMIDADHFKHINDQYGHAIGDIVLQQLGKCLSDGARETDIVGRWGGEEFIVVMPNTDRDSARAGAERIRELVAATAIDADGNSIALTISVGVAVATPGTLAGLIDRADDALYTAKREGRDRVVVARQFPALVDGVPVVAAAS